MSDATRHLDAEVQRGDALAAEELMPLVYEELRKLAASKLSGLPPGQTLQATALVHEAYVRLIGAAPQDWNSRGHFFAAAAEAMRRILIEQARRKGSQKRGGGYQRIALEEVDLAAETSSDVLLALDEALTRYAEKDPVGADLIKLRFFAGVPNQDAAAMLGVPDRSAKRTWAFARAWLYREIKKSL